MTKFQPHFDLQLYFVGFYKHEQVQYIAAGPFISHEDADKALGDLGWPTGGKYVVCSVNKTVELEVCCV